MICKAANKINLYKYLFVVLWLALWTADASAMTATISIHEKYAEVKAGDQVFFETDVKWPENTGRKDLRIEYSIKNKAGNEVAYLKVLKAIETQASFMDSIVIPASAVSGRYTVTAAISDYADLKQEVVASFTVVKAGNLTQNYLFIIIGVLAVLLVVTTIEVTVLMRRHHNI
jgi:hypothetical protein